MLKLNEQLNYFATSPKGLELLLVDELRSLGATDPREKLAGVVFTGDISIGYKACLWSRLANKILLQIHKASVISPEDLYQSTQQINWSEHFEVKNTFAIQAICVQSEINHSLFAAQKVKDAIVDQFRDKVGSRPDVNRENPDVSIYVYIFRNEAIYYIDLSGSSLHRRGYRLASGAAPLKENLAAAVLIRSNWPAIAKSGGALMDPMCGSGTLLIEGALMAADIAPGLSRDYFGFLKWKQHQPKIWKPILEEAQQRKASNIDKMPAIVGYDINPDAIHIAFENIERAGLKGKVHVEKRELAVFKPKVNVTPGLVMVNPPYGERLGEVAELEPLYGELGDKLKAEFTGWSAAVFTGNPDLGKKMGLRSHKQYALFNGDIACKLLLFNVVSENFVDRSPEAENKRRIKHAQRVVENEVGEALQMFVNRLRKNKRHLGKIAKRNNAATYRVYDADLPEYAFAIDVAESSVKVSEYQAPRGVDEARVLRRRDEVLAVLPEILEIDEENIHFTIISRS